MSDTTKIDKVRVNGVLYDLAGSGGGSSTGGYLFPATLFTTEALGYSEGSSVNLVSAEAVKQWLINCGVDLTQVVLDYDSNESLVQIVAGPSTVDGDSIFTIDLTEDSSNLNFYTGNLLLFDNTLNMFEIMLQEGDELTLSTVIDKAFENLDDSYVSLISFDNLIRNGIPTYVNMIYIFRNSINDYTYYPTAEVEDFIENVIQEASEGSSS